MPASVLPSHKPFLAKRVSLKVKSISSAKGPLAEKVAAGYVRVVDALVKVEVVFGDIEVES